MLSIAHVRVPPPHPLTTYALLESRRYVSSKPQACVPRSPFASVRHLHVCVLSIMFQGCIRKGNEGFCVICAVLQKTRVQSNLPIKW